jgi:hypothetical protein
MEGVVLEGELSVFVVSSPALFTLTRVVSPAAAALLPATKARSAAMHAATSPTLRRLVLFNLAMFISSLPLL